MVKIFVGNLSSSATKEDLRSLFSQYGKVAECDVLRNFGFVHMDTQKEAEEAVRKLHHHELNGQAINVEMSRGKPKGTTKLHVGNISSSCTNQELREKFAEFGSVVECDIVKDYAFVHMERREDAMEAISALDNATFQGKVINVQLSTSRLRTVPGMGDITGCYVCGEPGHWSKACRRGQNGSYGGGGGGGGGSPMGGIRATSGFPRAGPVYSSGVPAAFPSRSYSATLPPIPTVSYTPSYGISRDYTAETRYLSKPTAVYTERSITYELEDAMEAIRGLDNTAFQAYSSGVSYGSAVPAFPARRASYDERDPYGVVDYYEKYRARPYGGGYFDDRQAVPIPGPPPPPPPASSAISTERMPSSSLDLYERNSLAPPQAPGSSYYGRDRSPIRRLPLEVEGYAYDRAHVAPISSLPRSSAFDMPRDPYTDRARYAY
ncbi:RNA-binding protein 4.1 isoform X1, partial [Silurus asotus]